MTELTPIMAALLGLLQGLAEFLPISSSGHLNLLQALLGLDLDHQLLFNLLLHGGTLIAVLAVFWRDWWEMIRHPIKNNTLLMLFIASLPALAAKLLLGDTLDYYETHNDLLGVCFLLTGLLLALGQWLSKRNQHLHCETETVGVWQALAMGVMQAIGMLPGVSRSGSTIFGGICAKLTREKAAKFSFMMSMPAIVAGMASEGWGLLKEVKAGAVTVESLNLLPILIGVVVAGVSGYFAIRFMMKLISKVSLNWFALYVLLLGIAVILMQGAGLLTNPPADTLDAVETVARTLGGGL